MLVADLFRGLTDVGMTLDGDLMISPDGDLNLVDGFEWLYREVNKRIRTENPMWQLHPTVGANLSDFKGEPNTPQNAKRIRQRLKYILSQGNIGFPGEFAIRVIPTRPDGILIYIYLDMAGIRVELSKAIYDFHNGIVQSMEESNTQYRPLPQEEKLLRQDIKVETKGPNKYQDRIGRQSI